MRVELPSSTNPSISNPSIVQSRKSRLVVLLTEYNPEDKDLQSNSFMRTDQALYEAKQHCVLDRC